MTTFSHQRDEVLALCRQVRQLSRDRGQDAIAERIGAAAGQLEQGKLTIAVIGEFKRGKSSLLNALLDERSLFPVAPTIATSVVTTAAYAEEESITVYLDDGKGAGERAEAITRDEIADYVTEQGNPGNRAGARLLAISTPNPKLRDGLVAVDCPGVGGLVEEHTAITYGFVTSADVALIVSDALTPLTTRELEFVATVHQHCRAMVFAITKIDKVADVATAVANLRAKVATVLGTAADAIPVVPVSNLAKLAYLQSGDPEDLEMSGFAELEEQLWSILRQRRAAMLLLRPLGVLAETLDDLIVPLRTELDAYGAQTGAALEEVERELSETAVGLDQLRAGEAAWRRTLQRRLHDLRIEVEAYGSQSRLQARSRLSASLEDEELLVARPEQLVAQVERDLALLAGALAKRLEDGMAAAAAAVAAETGLSLNAAAPASRIAADAKAPAPAAVRDDDLLGLVMLKGAAGASFGLGAGGLVSGVVVSALALTGIGAAVLMLACSGFAATQLARHNVREQRRRTKLERQAELAKQVTPFLDESLAALDLGVRRALAEGERIITDEFEERLRGEQGRLSESAKALKDARKRTRSEADRRRVELEGPLASLERLRATVAGCAAAALDATAEPADDAFARPAARAPVAEAVVVEDPPAETPEDGTPRDDARRRPRPDSGAWAEEPPPPELPPVLALEGADDGLWAEA